MKGFSIETEIEIAKCNLVLGEPVNVEELIELFEKTLREKQEEIKWLNDQLESNEASEKAMRAEKDGEFKLNKAFAILRKFSNIEADLRHIVTVLKSDRLTKSSRLFLSNSLYTNLDNLAKIQQEYSQKGENQTC
jgi:hypothetical protein